MAYTAAKRHDLVSYRGADKAFVLGRTAFRCALVHCSSLRDECQIGIELLVSQRGFRLCSSWQNLLAG